MQLCIPRDPCDRTRLLAIALGLQHQRSTIESNPHAASAKQAAYRSPAVREHRFRIAASSSIRSTTIAVDTRFLYPRRATRSLPARCPGFGRYPDACPKSGQKPDKHSDLVGIDMPFPRRESAQASAPSVHLATPLVIRIDVARAAVVIDGHLRLAVALEMGSGPPARERPAEAPSLRCAQPVGEERGRSRLGTPGGGLSEKVVQTPTSG
jgi:hypothetical protein